MTNHYTINARDIIGVDVANPDGKKLGIIDDIMLDKNKGQVLYVVVSYGGFLGVRNKLLAMPWNIFSYDVNNNCFKIPLDENTLKNAPSLDKNHLPTQPDPFWTNSIHISNNEMK